MIIQCPSCGAKGKVDESRIPPEGAFAKCGKCGNRMRLTRPSGTREAGQQDAPAPQTPRHPEASPGPIAQEPRQPKAPAAGPRPETPAMPAEPVLGFRDPPPASTHAAPEQTGDGHSVPPAGGSPPAAGTPPGGAPRPVRKSLTNKELVDLAANSLQGNWSLAVLATFLLWVISGVLGIFDFTKGIITLVLTGPLTLGLTAFFLDLAQGRRPTVARIFYGFQRFLDALIAYLVVLVMIILWSLLLIIPGIVASFSYAMTFFILAEDESTDALAAWRESKRIMKGNRWKLFRLLFRISWLWVLLWTVGITFVSMRMGLYNAAPSGPFLIVVLIMLVVGLIGLWWVNIMVITGMAQFYEDIKRPS